MKIVFPKKSKSFRKGDSAIRPDFYWICILSLTLLSIAFLLVFGLYFFLETDKDSESSSSEIVGMDEYIKRTRIDDVIKYFDLREKRSLEIINSPSLIIDPSR